MFLSSGGGAGILGISTVQYINFGKLQSPDSGPWPLGESSEPINFFLTSAFGIDNIAYGVVGVRVPSGRIVSRATRLLQQQGGFFIGPQARGG